MINIHIVRDSTSFIWEFTVDGHAGYGEEGNDIICAAVSAITYTALGALDDIVGIRKYKKQFYIEQYGYIKCSLPVDLSEDERFKARIILDSMAIGLKQVKKAHSRYLKVIDEEV